MNKRKGKPGREKVSGKTLEWISPDGSTLVHANCLKWKKNGCQTPPPFSFPVKGIDPGTNRSAQTPTRFITKRSTATPLRLETIHPSIALPKTNPSESPHGTDRSVRALDHEPMRPSTPFIIPPTDSVPRPQSERTSRKPLPFSVYFVMVMVLPADEQKSFSWSVFAT